MELGHLAVIDWDLGLKIAGQKRDLAEELLDLFIQKLPDDVLMIKQLKREQNYPELLKRVHKLHSALCYCGLPRLKTVIAHLETDLKNNIMSNLPSLLDQLYDEVSLLLEQYSLYQSNTCSSQK